MYKWALTIVLCMFCRLVNDPQPYFYYLLFTATHSFRSSPSGSITACLKFPLPRVAAACFIKSYWCVPSGMCFFGLKVLLFRLPLQTKDKKIILHNCVHWTVQHQVVRVIGLHKIYKISLQRTGELHQLFDKKKVHSLTQRTCYVGKNFVHYTEWSLTCLIHQFTWYS